MTSQVLWPAHRVGGEGLQQELILARSPYIPHLPHTQWSASCKQGFLATPCRESSYSEACEYYPEGIEAGGSGLENISINGDNFLLT